jgi:hypothetical protein
VSVKIETCGFEENNLKLTSALSTLKGKDCLKRRITDQHSIPKFISHNELAVGAYNLLSEYQLSISCSHDLGLHESGKILNV